MNCFGICSPFISLDPSLTIPYPHPPSDNHTEQTAQGSQRGQTFSPPRHCVCFSLYLGLSSWPLLPGLSSWKPFPPLPPTPCAWLCRPLPFHCLLRACWMFCVSPWGSHRVKDGDYWHYCPGVKMVPDIGAQGMFVEEKKSFLGPSLLIFENKVGKKLNEFFMSDFDWWL